MAGTKRQLAAIMFTDIVGFTSLMSHEENRALQILKKNNNYQVGLVNKYGGKWHKDLGDGTLSSFQSSVDAVECAIAIQQLINTTEDFQLRIGIHLGDVTLSDGDVYGDGVNVASRLESEAANGGICVSESVTQSIKGNESIVTNYIGKYKLKNVSEPTKLYQVVANNVNSRGKQKRSILKLLLPFLLLSMFVSGYFGWILKPLPPKQVIRFAISLPNETERITDIALSSDGKTLVYGAYLNGYLGAQMFIRSINSFESQHVSGGDYIDDPEFSFNNREVVFGSRGELKVYSFETNEITSFGKSISLQLNGLTWKDDSIIYAPSLGDVTISGNLMKIARGGESELLISPKLDRGEIDLLNPFYIDEKNKLLYQVNSRSGYQIRMLDLKNKRNQEILQAESPRYASTGHLLYRDGSNLMGIAFNPENPEDLGLPVKLIPGIEVNLFAFSSNGTLIYVKDQEKHRTPVLVDRNGIESPISLPDLFWNGSPRWSPDQSKIVFRNPATNSLWIYDVDKGTSQILLSQRSNSAEWFPDGKSIVYRSGSMESIVKMDILNSGNFDTLISSNNSIYPVSISSDGNFMFYDEINQVDKKNIWIYDFLRNKSTPFISTDADESMAQFSPDNKLVVYCSDETGQFEIYLRKFEGNGEKFLISDDGGTEPKWSRNGKEIFYRNKNGIMSVPISNTTNIDFGEAELVIKGPFPPSSYSITNYDVSYDGRKFLMLKPVRLDNPKIHVVINWSEELKDLATK